MPTINFSLKDLQNLIGKKISVEELGEMLEYCKGSIDEISGDDITASLGDTNMPCLWSVEGIADLIKRTLGKQKGIYKINLKKNKDYKIIVESSVKEIRPCIASFVAKGKKIDNYLLNQMIQLQEKLSESYGKKRKKLAIGVYRLKNIKFPVSYKAVAPESVSFVPLGINRKMSLKEILQRHEKGIEYAYILKDFKKYPLLIDSKNEVLSFPPVINSDTTGKIAAGENEIFFEATGTDFETVNLAINIFAKAMHKRGFDIYSVSVNYGSKKTSTPNLNCETIRLGKEKIKEILGLTLSEAEVKKLVEKAGHEYNKGKVSVSPFRKDVLHEVDIIEDIAIMYGYNKVPEKPLENYTVGKTSEIVNSRNKARELMTGLGYQEILSAILNNKKNLYEKMSIDDFGTIEISDFMSETYSCVRTWIIPVLMEALSKNKDAEYPQKIFEQGLVTVRKGNEIKDYERIAAAFSDANANFTDIKQTLDFLMSNLGLKYEIEEIEHNSFIKGRVGRIIAKGKKVGFIGEINPQVLANWNLKMPAVAFELNLSEILEN